MRISKNVSTLALAAAIAAATPAIAANVMVGGQEMFPSKNIVQNALNSADHTTLVAAVKAAGLVETLQGPGPFTVFAPVNSAFNALPHGTVDTLLKPENKAQLTKVLTYHVVPERLTYDDLTKRVKDGKGMATIKTAAGQTLVATMNGPTNIAIKDSNGALANVAIYDVMQSNGVIHSIDKVLLPK